jgi:hypothetical protein
MSKKLLSSISYKNFTLDEIREWPTDCYFRYKCALSLSGAYDDAPP